MIHLSDISIKYNRNNNSRYVCQYDMCTQNMCWYMSLHRKHYLLYMTQCSDHFKQFIDDYVVNRDEIYASAFVQRLKSEPFIIHDFDHKQAWLRDTVAEHILHNYNVGFNSKSLGVSYPDTHYQEYVLR